LIIIVFVTCLTLIVLHLAKIVGLTEIGFIIVLISTIFFPGLLLNLFIKSFREDQKLARKFKYKKIDILLKNEFLKSNVFDLDQVEFLLKNHFYEYMNRMLDEGQSTENVEESKIDNNLLFSSIGTKIKAGKQVNY
ncbi:MAG: hypothetical protein JW833_13750, partial [Prolixibacteraceae bacterium]|nr:hypothetical protein [Prolixibacteraceae bacterium]